MIDNGNIQVLGLLFLIKMCDIEIFYRYGYKGNLESSLFLNFNNNKITTTITTKFIFLIFKKQ